MNDKAIREAEKIIDTILAGSPSRHEAQEWKEKYTQKEEPEPLEEEINAFHLDLTNPEYMTCTRTTKNLFWKHFGPHLKQQPDEKEIRERWEYLTGGTTSLDSEPEKGFKKFKACFGDLFGKQQPDNSPTATPDTAMIDEAIELSTKWPRYWPQCFDLTKALREIKAKHLKGE